MFISKEQIQVLEILQKIDDFENKSINEIDDILIKNNFILVPKILKNGAFSKRVYKVYYDFTGDTRKNYCFVDILKYKHKISFQYDRVS